MVELTPSFLMDYESLDKEHQALADIVNQVTVPEGFKRKVLPLLEPGTVLVATDAHLTAESSGESLRVIDSVGPRSWLDDVATQRHAGTGR